MSWKCNICRVENTTGEESCESCGYDLAGQMAMLRNVPVPVDNRKPAAKEIIKISSTENSPASKIPTTSNWNRSIYVPPLPPAPVPIDNSVKKNLETCYSNDNEDKEIPTKESNIRIAVVSD